MDEVLLAEREREREPRGGCEGVKKGNLGPDSMCLKGKVEGEWSTGVYI